MNGLLLARAKRSKSLMLFTALAGMAAGPAVAAAAAQAPAPVAPRPTLAPSVAKPKPAQNGRVTEAPVPGNPDFAPDHPDAQQATPVPAPLPPAIWDMASAQQLLQYIEQIGVEGLNPQDYDPEGLQTAIASGDVTLLSAAATQRFDLVSSDLALGHVKKPARIDWYVVDKDLNAEKQDALLRSALAMHNIAGALEGLLPTHPQYAALKAALAKAGTDDSVARDRIRLNMDRWRWLPRDLGE
jgi:murein L,D-transpeptidase YcbB/YkuD